MPGVKRNEKKRGKPRRIKNENSERRNWQKRPKLCLLRNQLQRSLYSRHLLKSTLVTQKSAPRLTPVNARLQLTRTETTATDIRTGTVKTATAFKVTTEKCEGLITEVLLLGNHWNHSAKIKILRNRKPKLQKRKWKRCASISRNQ